MLDFLPHSFESVISNYKFQIDQSIEPKMFESSYSQLYFNYLDIDNSGKIYLRTLLNHEHFLELLIYHLHLCNFANYQEQHH